MPTTPRFIQTPTGPATGSIFAKMEGLGVSSFLTQTGNQPNDQRQFEEIVNISVPIATHCIVASQDFWTLAFGSLTSIRSTKIPIRSGTRRIIIGVWAGRASKFWTSMRRTLPSFLQDKPHRYPC